MTRLILASTSRARKQILENAGLRFDAMAPMVDEETYRHSLGANGVKPRDIADLILLGALWGASFLFMRVAAPEFGPIPLIAVRVAVLLPVAATLAWIICTSVAAPAATDVPREMSPENGASWAG